MNEHFIDHLNVAPLVVKHLKSTICKHCNCQIVKRLYHELGFL